MSTYISRQTYVDPDTDYDNFKDRTLILNYYNEKGGGKYYKMRPSTLYSGAPLFNFADRKKNGIARGGALVSLPLYAKISGLQSVKDIKFERLIIKMSSMYDSIKDQVFLVDEMKKELSVDTRNNVKFFTEENRTLAYVEATISTIFNVIIIITMFLCFFQLSSSMSANLYD